MTALRAAVSLALVGATALFIVQLLWTHGLVEDLLDRQKPGSHGLRQHGKGSRSKAAAAATAGLTAGSRLDSLARPDGGGGNGAGTGGGVAAAGGAAATDGTAAAVGVAVHGGAMFNPALIVFCYNRPSYLNQTLHSLLGLAGLERYSIYVSQDGNDAAVAAVVGRLAPHFLRVTREFAFWQKHPRAAQLGAQQAGHAWLAQHYKWGLDRVFLDQGHSHVVIVEDDMLFSPDFLLYFEATAPLLEQDPTLWCISSWNDNGFAAGHGWDVRRLFRTSYFPGLGWMMKRQLWLELGPKWPLDHWDHWMRDDEVSRGRDCICPEVNRNRNIGEVGANMNKQAFKRYLKTMGFNADHTVSDFGDLSHLLLPAYTAALQQQISQAPVWDFSYRRDAPKPQPGSTYLVPYTIEQYSRIALRLKLWPYPRGHHQHVASIPWGDARFLVADRRFCPLLPKDQQLAPTPGLQTVAGRKRQSCTDVCAERGLACYAKDFWWLNTCSVLRRHFACEHGCTVELGPDVPAYVADANQTLYKYCLITQKSSTCAAKHAATARLCACVPTGSGLAQPDAQLQQLQGRAIGTAAVVAPHQRQQQQQGEQQAASASDGGGALAHAA